MNPSIDLEAAKAAFFASGGQIIVLEGFQYVPFRQRHHPEPKPKRVKPVKQERGGERKSRAKARTESSGRRACQDHDLWRGRKAPGRNQDRSLGRSGAGRIQVLQPAEAGHTGEGKSRTEPGGS